MRSFAEVSEEYNSLSKRLNEIRPEARAVALQAYKTGMRTSDIVSALGIATPTFYVWLREAHEPVTGNRRNTEFNVEIDTATEVEFGWFENKVRVDRSGKRVFIDPERINVFECWRDQPVLDAWRRTARATAAARGRSAVRSRRRGWRGRDPAHRRRGARCSSS